MYEARRRRLVRMVGVSWGKVDPGESMQEALSREIKEELGILVNPKSKICEIDYSYKDRDVNLNIFDCGLVNPQDITLKEHGDSRWLAREELLEVNGYQQICQLSKIGT